MITLKIGGTVQVQVVRLSPFLSELDFVLCQVLFECMCHESVFRPGVYRLIKQTRVTPDRYVTFGNDTIACVLIQLGISYKRFMMSVIEIRAFKSQFGQNFCYRWFTLPERTGAFLVKRLGKLIHM